MSFLSKLSLGRSQRESQMPGAFPASSRDSEFSSNWHEDDEGQGIGASSGSITSPASQKPLPKEARSAGNALVVQRSPHNSSALVTSPVRGRDKVELNSNDIFIALMGVTGAGKSTFISHCTSTHVEIGDDMESCELPLPNLTLPRNHSLIPSRHSESRCLPMPI
jgi:hypothetical protein